MIHHAKTIEEVIDDLQEFLEADMWYAKDNEWHTEEEMTKLAEAMNKLAINLNNAQPSGLIPAVVLSILT